VDDAPFSFGDRSTLLVGVVMRTPAYIESILSTTVDIDGNNGTTKLIDLVTNSRHRDQLKALMLDGASVGGFNVIDIEKLYSKTGVPVITITRDYPDFDSIKKALQAHFKDWHERWECLSTGDLVEIKTINSPIYIKTAGLELKLAKELLKLSTIRGNLPEPLRIAHLIASGIATGESSSKA
jgi:endonuclease V-like protein UPF0215 family